MPRTVTITRIEEFDDGKIITTVTEFPKETSGTVYYRHKDGTTRSRKNRWAIGNSVRCTECTASISVYCIGTDGKTLAYPHNSRFKEGLAVLEEEFPDSPWL